jgi:pimeloyl-ACP methyl ester carboxylesterase
MSASPDLLLLHGALGAGAQLAPLAQLLGSRYRVHVLDFEGHGDLPPRDRPFRISHFGENVIEYLDEHAVERAHVFGYSMGGYVALHLAAACPERVGDVATLGTKFDWTPDVAAREAGRLDPTAIRAKVPRFAEALADRHANAGGWEGVLARTADLLRELGYRPAVGARELSQVGQRVRIMVGDRDVTTSVEESAAAYRSLPAGELAVLPCTPHPLEQVDCAMLARTLVDYFD